MASSVPLRVHLHAKTGLLVRWVPTLRREATPRSGGVRIAWCTGGDKLSNFPTVCPHLCGRPTPVQAHTIRRLWLCSWFSAERHGMYDRSV